MPRCRAASVAAAAAPPPPAPPLTPTLTLTRTSLTTLPPTQADIYPATLATTRKLSPLDLMAVHRDMYEGTSYDMTQAVP